MGRGKFKGKPTGRRQFSTPEEMLAGTSRHPRTFKQEEVEAEENEKSKEESEEDSDGEKRKGTQGIIEIENPNLVKPKNVKAKNVDIEKTTELSRRERLVEPSFVFPLKYDPNEVTEDKEALLYASYMFCMNTLSLFCSWISATALYFFHFLIVFTVLHLLSFKPCVTNLWDFSIINFF